MSSHIRIGKYVLKPASVTWKTSVSNITDTCVIELPLSTYTQTDAITTDNPDSENVSGTVFREGDPVNVRLGYDNRLYPCFSGFVKRINMGIPLSLECEGYSYQLSDQVFNKSYRTTTVREIVTDLCKGTDIKPSKYIPDISLGNITFKSWPKVKMLEWFQKECLLAVFFDTDQLYVGVSRFGIPKDKQKLRLRYNTVDDKNFKKQDNRVSIQINLVEKNPKGEVKVTKSDMQKYTTTKEVKIRAGISANIKQAIANELQKLENYKGYKGTVTCFLEPFFQPGMTVLISDLKFPERGGNFFVESVDGTFNKSGGRQTITLNYYGN